MSFVHSCLSHDSYLIRFVANYAVAHARSQSSFLGHNVLFCAHHYNFSVNIYNRLSSLDNSVKSFVHDSIDDHMRNTNVHFSVCIYCISSTSPQPEPHIRF